MAVGLTGALLIAVNRSVLLAGVMMALSLVPAAALGGYALVVGDPATAGGAALRWVHDALIVFACAYLVVGIHRKRQRRTTQA
ncbi:hypothetical protein ACWT_5786 [Actinoplanes sp. SE50]|uniref:DUF389 domain-containing protein n=1 Tax=unclassified Actinoplanes TaxID=2626549 RepID=UPI00023ED68F|nr:MULTISPECIES: DUF389 domain-containing protein [unclassified Actinoplanes]AEV86804.1 hypothetical protein ACPL_5917 [Actinoplanes sp. SE50/110]ATO85201.1 hypothetical protein ACWT_5786 [Actinoplanes sp. SE50]SLM02611.1 DUF389 domain-containing protein [Actinoplanes sp. SE50/110]